jgi:hypothetical protein
MLKWSVRSQTPTGRDVRKICSDLLLKRELLAILEYALQGIFDSRNG